MLESKQQLQQKKYMTNQFDWKVLDRNIVFDPFRQNTTVFIFIYFFKKKTKNYKISIDIVRRHMILK